MGGVNSAGPADAAGVGGRGASGDLVDGEDGQGIDAGKVNGGGGGGSVGRIRINATRSFANRAIISPSQASGALTTGSPPSKSL